MVCARVVVRSARAGDAAARASLHAALLAETRIHTFIYFFFQELTLQVVVLCSAVLFIFMGVWAGGCALVAPLTAAAVYGAVWAAERASLALYQQRLRQELCGYVAELSGPLSAHVVTHLQVLHEHQLSKEELHDFSLTHRQVIGTVSLCSYRGAADAGWVSALGVTPRWRRRGVGRALLAAVRGEGCSRDLVALHAVVSQLQPAARFMLHAAGWECRGTYHRQLVGDALTVPMAHLVLDLTHYTSDSDVVTSLTTHH